MAKRDSLSRSVTTRQTLVAVGSLSLFLLFATTGFRVIEGWSWFDSLYMVVISVTTVGYGEVHPLSTGGRVLAMFVIISGVGVGSYVLLTLTRIFFEGVVEGSIQRALTRRRVRAKLPDMKNHTIVCGYGRLGAEICKELRLAGRGVVVVDPDEAKIERAGLDGYLFVQGDASDDDALLEAGIQRAGSLAIATASDALNTYITISARSLNPTLHILARATEEAAIKRLRTAGANQAVSPYHVGGLRMAALLIRPAVVDFLDVASLGDFPDLFIEQLGLEPGSRLEGESLRSAEYHSRYKVIVLSLKRPGAPQTFLPDPNEPFRGGDLLIVAGHRKDLDRLASDLRG